MVSIKNNLNTLKRSEDLSLDHFHIQLVHYNTILLIESQHPRRKERKAKVKMGLGVMLNLHIIVPTKRKLYRQGLPRAVIKCRFNGRVRIWILKKTTG